MTYDARADLAADLQLVLAAATSRRDDETRIRIRALAGTADWEASTRAALAHSVVVPVFDALEALAPDLVPDDVMAAAATFRAAQTDRNEALADELAAMLAALLDDGIPAAPFKGPLLAIEAYGDLGRRQFRDLDFLVPEDRIDACYATLERLGYRGTHRLSPAQTRAFRAYAGEDILFHRERGTAVEPHWAFAPRTFAVDLDYAALWRRMRRTTFRGVAIHALAPEDTVLALAIHGGKEQWTRLQWVCDFVETVQASPALDWDRVVALATAGGCARLLAIALELGRLLLDLSPPPSLRPWLERDDEALRLAAAFARDLFAAADEPPSIYTVTRLRWRLRERARDRLAYAWRTVTTPRTIHFGMLALPDPLIWLYRPAKLVHDYALLPVWLRLHPPRS